MRKMRLNGWIVAPTLLGWVGDALACPGCFSAASRNASGGDALAGFQWSLLFMMSVPFLLAITFAFCLVRLNLRSRNVSSSGSESCPR